MAKKTKSKDLEEQINDSTTEMKNESEEKNIELQRQLEEMKEKHLRLYAEFENYKKRTAKEKIELIKTASESIISALLPVLDDFDRAKKAAESTESAENFSEGVQLVYSKLHHVLQQRGLKSMDTSGGEFDPELHEAITKVPVDDENAKGKIIDVVEKGYYLNDKIIRHAKVVIGA